jgi:hypothetical protein
MAKLKTMSIEEIRKLSKSNGKVSVQEEILKELLKLINNS